MYKYLVPVTAIYPAYKIPCEYKEMDPEYLAKYKELYEDPRNILDFSAMTARIWVEEQRQAEVNVK